MSRIGRGEVYTWSAVVTSGQGDPVDCSDLTLTVTGPGGAPPAGFPILFGDLSHDGTGLYHYDWLVPLDADSGTYVGTWSGITVEAEVVSGSDSVDVVLGGTVVPELPEAPAATYMTPARFRAMNLIGLTGYTDYQIESFLEDASAEVDSYCNVPLLPYPHSFLGGSAVDEEHRWRFPDSPTGRGQRRVYPKHWPIREVSSFAIKVGYGTVAPIPTDALVINNKERWIEVTALTISNTSGLFGVSGWIVPMGGLTVPMALISYTYGWLYPVVDERIRPLDATNKVFLSRHGFWTGAVSVKVDGVPVDGSTYEVDAEEGQITFDTATTGVVQASYTHKLPREIPRATALVATHLIGEDKLRRKNMSGLSQLRVNEISATRAARLRGDNPADLALLVPDAALLLAGFRYWSAA